MILPGSDQVCLPIPVTFIPAHGLFIADVVAETDESGRLTRISNIRLLITF